MTPASGIFDGLSTLTVPPLLINTTLYSTEGADAISSWPNSRSRRSWMISMWSRPRKPQRKPKPSATELSGSKLKLASLRCSFSIASRRFGYSEPMMG